MSVFDHANRVLRFDGDYFGVNGTYTPRDLATVAFALAFMPKAGGPFYTPGEIAFAASIHGLAVEYVD